MNITKLILIYFLISLPVFCISQKVSKGTSANALADQGVDAITDILKLSPNVGDKITVNPTDAQYFVQSAPVTGHVPDTFKYVVPTLNGLYAVKIPPSTTYVVCIDSVLAMPHLNVGDFIYVESRLCGENYGGGLFVVTQSGKTTDGGTVFVFDKDLYTKTFTQNKSVMTTGTNQDEYYEYTLPDGNINWGSFSISRPDQTKVFDDIQYFPNMINYQTGDTYWLYRHALNVEDVSNMVTLSYDTIKTDIRLERIRTDQGSFNIDWFGAKRDDRLYNNSGAIEECMRAAERSGSVNVYVPAGIYYYTSTVTIPNNLHLYGDGPGQSILKSNVEEIYDFYYTTDGGSTYPNRTSRASLYNTTGFLSGRFTEKNTLTQKTWYFNQEVTTFKVTNIEFDGRVENRLILSTDTTYTELYNNLLNGGFHNGFVLGNSDSLDNFYFNNVHIHNYGGNLIVKGGESTNAYLKATDLKLGNSSHNHLLYSVNGHIQGFEIYGYSNGSWIDGKGLIIKGMRADLTTNPVGIVGSARVFSFRGEEVPFQSVTQSGLNPTEHIREKCIITDAQVIIRGAHNPVFVGGVYQGLDIQNLNINLKNNAKVAILQNVGNNLAAYKYGVTLKNIFVRLEGTSEEITIIKSASGQYPVYPDLLVDGFTILGRTNYFPANPVTVSSPLFYIDLDNYTTVFGGYTFDATGLNKDSLSGEHFTVTSISSRPDPLPRVFWFDVSGSDSAPSLGGSKSYHKIDVSSTSTSEEIIDSIAAIVNAQDTLISQVYEDDIATGHLGYDPQGWGYITVDSDSTQLVFAQHRLSYNKRPINWTIRNLRLNNPFASNDGLIYVSDIGSDIYPWDIKFENCSFGQTGSTQTFFRYQGNAKFTTYSTLKKFRVKFKNCEFRQHPDITTQSNRRYLDPMFHLFYFEDCVWVNSQLNGTVKENPNVDNRKLSNYTALESFTAIASQPTQDFSCKLPWDPKIIEVIAANNAFREYADSIEVINTRQSIAGHPEVTDSWSPMFRLHLKAGIPGGTQVKFRYRTSVSDPEDVLPYTDYDLIYDISEN